jgi:hypothetical protein
VRRRRVLIELRASTKWEDGSQGRTLLERRGEVQNQSVAIKLCKEGEGVKWQWI